MSDDALENQTPERRRYFRIQDEVGLFLDRIAPGGEQEALKRFAERSSRAGLMNELRALRDEHLPQRRSIELKFPALAEYLRVVERQIDTLALTIDDRDDFPVHANQTLNLSAQGISLVTDEAFAIGDRVEIKLTLFPERTWIEVIAQVVRVGVGADNGETAFEFTHLREPDREAIIRHVYQRERQQLQARVHD